MSTVVRSAGSTLVRALLALSLAAGALPIDGATISLAVVHGYAETSIGGEKSLGDALGAQARLISRDVTVVVLKDAGHWIMEERPAETMDALVKFLR